MRSARTRSASCSRRSSASRASTIARRTKALASRPECAVRAHQRQGRCGAGQTAARHLCRYEEEGAGRQLQERRLRLSAEGRSAPRQRARLRGQGAGQGGALRRLRRDGQRGLRQCRHHRRYRRVCRAGDPHLARAHGPAALSAGERADDHGRLRRLERARVRRGKSSCKSSPTRPASCSTSTTIRRAHRSGKR